MTDLKALREQIVKGVIQRVKCGYDMEATFDIALLQYAEACLGEPSEGMIDAPIASYGTIGLTQYSRGMWREMASQRLKEIK